MQFNIRNNWNLRSDGNLVKLLDLDKHSEPAAFLIRPAPNYGLLVQWNPVGPGVGRWDVLPVNLTSSEDESIELEQFSDPYESSAPDETMFAGEAELCLGKGREVDRIGSQEQRSDPRGKEQRPGLSKIQIHVASRCFREWDEDLPEDTPEDPTGEVGETPARIQDEPWGPMWEDLKDQVDILISSGVALGGAVIAVQRGFFREKAGSGLSVDDGKRLQRQLMSIFRE